MHPNNQAGTFHFFLGNILAAVECSVCREKKTIGSFRYENLIKCTTYSNIYLSVYLPFSLRKHSCGCWVLYLSWEDNSRWLWLRKLNKMYNRNCSTATERLLHGKTTSSVTFCRSRWKRYHTYHCLWTSSKGLLRKLKVRIRLSLIT